MRKFNGIVLDKVAPNDPEVLWLNSEGLFVCEGGVWTNIYQSLKNSVDDLDEEINDERSGLAGQVSTLSETVDSIFDDTDNASIISRISSLEETVYTEEPEEEETQPVGE